MDTEIEKQTIQWLSKLIGYPAAAGIMVSGGNMANFVGFCSARQKPTGISAKKAWCLLKENGGYMHVPKHIPDK
jgi:glutamate/tyrosine decarboxylase-like PLP-dependent enzyme